VSVIVGEEGQEFTSAYGRLGHRAMIIIGRELPVKVPELPAAPKALMVLIARFQG